MLSPGSLNRDSTVCEDQDVLEKLRKRVCSHVLAILTTYIDSNISSNGVLPNICEALRKYGLFDYFKLWFETSVFPVYSWWKTSVRRIIRENQNEVWSDFCLKQAYDCLNNVPPYHFWSLANHYPDLVSWLHVQVRIMGDFGLNGGISWLTSTAGATCFVCKQGVETVNHFLLECPGFKENLDGTS